MLLILAEIIQLHTAQRLHFDSGLSLKCIDRLGILPTLRINNEAGLLWDNSQRSVFLLCHFKESPIYFQI